MDDLVTEVRADKRGALVTVNGAERLWFGREAWAERSLAEGEAVDLAEVKQWLLPRQYPYALDAAVRLLAVRARSERELRDRLGQKPYLGEAVDLAMYKLQKNGLQSDEAFAREWARERLRQGLGAGRIRAELRQKGVASALCERVVAELDEDARADAGAALAAKLLRRYQSHGEKAAADKAMAGMARRGYGYDEAREALSRARNGLENGE